MKGLDFSKRPLLVFWETTKACLLKCKHCRADAITMPLPGELDVRECYNLLEQIRSFGKPYPVTILTGGDMLMKRGIFDIISHAVGLGLPIAASPTVSEILTTETLEGLRRCGVSYISFSLDGLEHTHDYIRGVPGTWRRTIDAIKKAIELGFKTQVNTCVMSANVDELPEIFSVLLRLNVDAWEVFYLVNVGRGTYMRLPDPKVCGEIAHFLYEAARYGVVVRTVEAPFYRRILLERSSGAQPPKTQLYRSLVGRLRKLCGEPRLDPPEPRITPTRDGNGIVFIGHDGSVRPGGFLPITRGNVRDRSVVEIYRGDPLFSALRRSDLLKGACGSCSFRDVCGGSRARAYSTYGDPLAQDPACPYVLEID